MLVSRYQIGKKEMIITKNDNGELVSVTDEKKVPANECSMNKVKLTSEEAKFRSPTTYVSNDTFILTSHNPTCGWYFWNRRWYYICTG